MGYLHSENVLFCVLQCVTFVNGNIERCKEVFEYLTRGGYPEGYRLPTYYKSDPNKG